MDALATKNVFSGDSLQFPAVLGPPISILPSMAIDEIQPDIPPPEKWKDMNPPGFHLEKLKAQVSSRLSFPRNYDTILHHES